MTAPEHGDRPLSGPAALFRELHRRRVIRTTLYYAGASVAVVEAADAFAGPLGLPDGAVRALAILAVSGVPLVVGLSWAYDLSSDGPGPNWLGRAGRGVLLAGLAALSLTIAAVMWSRQNAPASTPDITESDRPATRIAVLAFEAPGASSDLQVLAEHLHGRLIDGLSDAVSGSGLAEDDRLRVISRAGVLPFSGGNLTVDSIGHALDVGTIVEGTLESVRDSVRVRLRLIDARTAEQLDARVAHAALTDPVALADNLGDTAVTMLRSRLGDVVKERARRLGTRSPEAFRYLVWADASLAEFDSAMARRDLEGARRSLETSDSLYQEATRLDPRWPEPLVQRGFASDQRAQLATVTGADVTGVYRRGYALADQALALASNDHRALHLRGMMGTRLAGIVSPDEATTLRSRAETDLRASILGNPTPASALRMLSELLASQGRLDEALAFGNRAYSEDRYLDNIAPTLLRLFQYSLSLGRDAEAQRHCTEGRRRFGSAVFEDCHLVLMAWSDLVAPDPDSAWATMARELDAYPAALRPRLEPRLRALVAAVLAGAGLPDSAVAVLSRARADDPGTVGVALVSAGTRGLVGDLDSALGDVRWLQANAEGVDLRSAPELRPLRGAPRFEALVAGTPERD